MVLLDYLSHSCIGFDSIKLIGYLYPCQRQIFVMRVMNGIHEHLFLSRIYYYLIKLDEFPLLTKLTKAHVLTDFKVSHFTHMHQLKYHLAEIHIN